MENQRTGFAIAIVDPNVMSALGLQHILMDIAPMAESRIFVTFSELEAAEESFVHYFVASRIYF